DATEEELRAKLESMVAARDIPADQLHTLIELFVEEVGVITHDHCTESVVVVRWRDRRTKAQHGAGDALEWLPEAHDILLCWRYWNRDDRAWTTEEDAALKMLWPASSGASYNEIKAALLPGRKWNKLYKRVMELKLTDGSLARQWQIAAERSERSPAYLNPELGYMVVQARSGWHDLLDWASADGEGPDALWTVACGHNGELLDTPMIECNPFPLAGGWQLPVRTEECLKMVISSLGYAPRRPLSSNIPRSPAGCEARHPEFDPGACIVLP
ncbi:MAG: hypothetical protein M3Y13_10330, partial [Armatimonadota bacterium]|nr:hypothetical protein [Armatimonadota bacterium]